MMHVLVDIMVILIRWYAKTFVLKVNLLIQMAIYAQIVTLNVILALGLHHHVLLV